MARVTYVKSARGSKKGPLRCTCCGTEIKVGDQYKWFANRIGRSSIRKNFCNNCQIRPSDMTTSDKLATLYSAQEGAGDALSQPNLTLDEMGEIIRSYAETVREVGEEYGESADNIESGFGHETQMSEEIREKADACESCADEAENAADDIESMDDPDAAEEDILLEYEGEVDDNGKPLDPDDWEAVLEEKREERREAARTAAYEAVNEGPQF